MRWPTTPIGLLMIEHRLIKRVLANAPLHLAGLTAGGSIPAYIDVVADFLHIYADRTHHGKEEDILFRQLAGKSPDAEVARLMEELLDEHAHARETTGRLVDANMRFRTGDQAALAEIEQTMGELVRFYQRHIEKEDRHFFKPCMAYFSAEERQAMLGEFADLDRTMIHEKYREVVDGLEGAGEGNSTLA
jgi:hemerythrin-like domain-containing protein